eukprot:8360207-Pyramimonas_sp.AAC.2
MPSTQGTINTTASSSRLRSLFGSASLVQTAFVPQPCLSPTPSSHRVTGAPPAGNCPLWEQAKRKRGACDAKKREENAQMRGTGRIMPGCEGPSSLSTMCTTRVGKGRGHIMSMWINRE